jgi:hypothetical protein
MPEGTYMLFIDFDDWLKSHGVAQNELLKNSMKSELEFRMAASSEAIPR